MGIEIREGDIAGAITSLNDPRPGKSFAALLKNAGSPSMNVNGSVTPVSFTAEPPTGKKWYVHQVSLVIEDVSINFTKFGGITALTNGIDVKVKEAGLAEETLGNFKKNGDFYILSNSVFLESSTTDILHMRFDVRDNTGTTFQLTDANSEFFKVVINDDLTTIDRFNVLIRGYEVDE